MRFIIFDSHPGVKPNAEWTDRILCLANSYKHEHRCVAGISLITKQWVRLIGRQVPGCLTVREASYPDGKEVAILDVFEVEFDEKCGSNCHPEDSHLTAKPIRLIHRSDEPAKTKHLPGLISKRPTVLQGYGDRVTAHRVEETPMERSLELIEPEDLWWWIRDDHGKRKNRAIFRVSHTSRIRYDFAVTDPAWLNQLRNLPLGIHPHALLCGERHPRTLLTVSLSEPFDGFLYKLVAGVVCLPA